MKRKFIFILALVFYQADAQSIKIQFADSLFVNGNYINAINEYSKLGLEKASLQIARAYNAIGNFEKAIAQYKALVSENSTLGIAKFELAKLYLKTKKYFRAKELLGILTAEFPRES
ncbi:tetratricopeptide repeat protein [Maribacter litopenaei]|uniref:Tetratricopeptide repeat protein n=1 Tax=Maribacter litopenaei TaxID=2976127 RepID=A0ABY5Y9A4_9FLAO|nr:tetratricopeptide repeat protein [Maribacter litopenaei]UWX55416.1 tetratricopeptide repeat protein [Maribacter litopenaei]